MEQQTNKKTKQTNKGLSSLSKLVKIDLYQICLEQKRRKEVQTMSRLKCTLAGKCGWQIPSLPLITLLVCTSLHHICPSQIWCIFFSFNARYFRTHMYAKKTFLRLWNCQILNLDFFLFNGVYLFQTPRKWSAGIVITAPLYQSKQVLLLLGWFSWRPKLSKNTIWEPDTGYNGVHSNTTFFILLTHQPKHCQLQCWSTSFL